MDDKECNGLICFLLDAYRETKQLKGNTKGMFVLFFLRIASITHRKEWWNCLFVPIRVLYDVLVWWVFGIDIPAKTKIGFGLRIFHGFGLVVHECTIIGNNVTIRHNTTIGLAKDNQAPPKIEDDVDIGANSVVIGNITVGKNSIIAAGSVVVKDVPPFSIVAGNPAKLIKVLK